MISFIVGHCCSPKTKMKALANCGRFSSRQIDVEIVDIDDIDVDFVRFAKTSRERLQKLASISSIDFDAMIPPVGALPPAVRHRGAFTSSQLEDESDPADFAL